MKVIFRNMTRGQTKFTLPRTSGHGQSMLRQLRLASKSRDSLLALMTLINSLRDRDAILQNIHVNFNCKTIPTILNTSLLNALQTEVAILHEQIFSY